MVYTGTKNQKENELITMISNIFFFFRASYIKRVFTSSFFFAHAQQSRQQLNFLTPETTPLVILNLGRGIERDLTHHWESCNFNTFEDKSKEEKEEEEGKTHQLDQTAAGYFCIAAAAAATFKRSRIFVRPEIE